MLTHKPSATIVYQSTDYEKFTFISGNRPINQAKINRIIAEIEDGNDMLEYNPIQVEVDLENNVMPIDDGQHRYLISMRLQRPVYYIIIRQKKSLRDIASINSNTEKWTDENFINCYIANGNGHYITLKQFVADYGVNIGTSLSLLGQGAVTSGGAASIRHQKNAFQNGEFEVKHLETAISFVKMAKGFDKFPQWNGRVFLYALQQIQNAQKVKIEDIIAMFNKYPEMLEVQPNFKKYIRNLEEIFNHRKHSHTPIN